MSYLETIFFFSFLYNCGDLRSDYCTKNVVKCTRISNFFFELLSLNLENRKRHVCKVDMNTRYVSH